MAIYKCIAIFCWCVSIIALITVPFAANEAVSQAAADHVAGLPVNPNAGWEAVALHANVFWRMAVLGTLFELCHLNRR